MKHGQKAQFVARPVVGGRGRSGATRTPLAVAFRRLVATIVEPAFHDVRGLAADDSIDCAIDAQLNGIQPRVMFCVRPSGRSLRFELDADGLAVREIEGVYYRAMGQRRVWTTPEEMMRQLTAGYARSGALACVQEHFHLPAALGGRLR